MSEPGFWDYKIAETYESQPNARRCPVILAKAVLEGLGVRNLPPIEIEPVISQCKEIIRANRIHEGEAV